MNSRNHLLFVYGSLLSGLNQPAFEYIRKYFSFVAQGSVKGLLYDMGTYPAAVPDAGEHYILGELYELNKAEEFSWAFGQLDDYEGINSEEDGSTLYRRDRADIYVNGEVFNAWIYWYCGEVSGRPVISSGNVADYFLHKIPS
ncbi:gamma-glutamylcyclotransferase [Segetibacter sp. 3557_3]|uniref:gamma-glutamylcyclotransferase family protein n=1 Tax=Segetibacter sp. 3557_3 TaxID=2547429 RepID=UPI001058F23B|nr:gamma-glutamylcyclotransferase family protein [Segetibacter sp. 3557_3]TDH24086.1 gamma-glutamylcyclotransferase [Segetibacter sp. 3557_3]